MSKLNNVLDQNDKKMDKSNTKVLLIREQEHSNIKITNIDIEQVTMHQ